MSSLSAKLAIALFVLLLALGVITVMLTLETSHMYLQEVQQKLQRDLAEHLVEEHVLLERGSVREGALEEIFKRLMVVNPDIEVYLLDSDGRILAYSAPPGRVVRDRVSLPSVRAFLEGSMPLPILGDDPRNREAEKIFSVAPVLDEGGRLVGYLYVILASEQFDSVAQMLERSYILRASTWMVAGSILVALAGGVVVFVRLTRRVRSLAAEMAEFEAQTLVSGGPGSEVQEPSKGDEIDRLQRGFRRMAGRIRSQIEEMEQTDRLRRDLVANISHDVRTPLTHLQGYLETLLMKEETLSADERREYLEIATQQSEQLGRMVTDLFELAKLDTLAEPLEMETFAASELVQDVAQEFKLAAGEQGISLRAEIERERGLVKGNLGMIERVLQNLLANALQYTRAGDEITVSVRPLGEELRIAVADTGPGIPADELPHIFDRFHRCRSRGAGAPDGSGLGLAIAKRALELHDSDLVCDSSVGVGTTFRFDLKRPVPHS
jgi:signal transduction histidine kinase